MLKYKLSEIISNIDEEYICEATDYVRVKSRRFLNWIKGKVWILGLAVLIVLGVKFMPVLLGNIFEKEPEKLVICTDWSTYDKVRNAVSNWKAMGRKHSTSVQTEIIRIPSDKESAEIKITELRTEIMAGKGPDLFILQSNEPYNYSKNGEIHMLFPNPEKAMYSEIFLPLDNFLENAEFIKTEDCNQVVLQAGQTEDGQMLLPIIYSYDVCFFQKEGDSGTNRFPVSWEEISSNKSIGAAIRTQVPFSLPYYFGQLADYETEALLISEETLLKQFKTDLSDTTTWDNVTWEHMDRGFFDYLAEKNEKVNTFYPVPNIDGGVTALVSVYAGINQNTKFTEEAFALLDSFYEYARTTGPFPMGRGIFIAQDEYYQRLYRLRWIQEEDINSFLEMNVMITTARFYSNWDTQLGDIYLGHWDKDAPTAEEAVSELYNDMLMQIKE